MKIKMTPLRILFVSDLHYTRREAELGQGEWLLNLLDEIKPELLLSAGDWDELADEKFLNELVQKVPVLTIYGNHENMDALRAVKNPLFENVDILLPDYTPFQFKGLKIVGVSGIWSGKRRSRRGVPRKKGTEFIDLAREFYEKYAPKEFDIDILLMHDVPNIPEYEEKIIMHGGTEMVREVIELLKPKLVLNGHIHLSEYTFAKLDYGGYYLRVDSSAKHRGFAVIEWSKDIRVRVYKERMSEELFSAMLGY